MVLPWLASAWILGIAAGPAVSFPGWQWATLVVIAGLAAWATRREPRLGWTFLAISCCCLGALRASAAEDQRAAATIASSIRATETVDLKGTVVSATTSWGESFTFDMRAEWIAAPGESEGASADGSVQVVSATWLPAGRGERVAVRGHLRRPTRFEGIHSSAVLEAVSIRRLAPPPALYPAALLDGARSRIVDRLHRVLPAGEASLVAGVLLGADEQMPESVQEAFRATGTAHILAVSGFNVTIVAAAAATVFGRLLGARRGALAAGAMVVLYTLLCGAEAAVVRAALMACVALVALRLGRQPAALASLAAAAILMSLLEPGVIFDVGFQLSFLATLGLVLAGRPSQEAIRGWGERAIPHEGARSAAVLFAELAVLSLVAQAATLPLSAYVFHRLPLTSLPANALILPAQPLLMATGAATAAASLVSLPLGSLAAWLSWPVAAYTIRVAELFASLPGASLALAPFPSGYLFLAYAALGGLVLATRWPKARAAGAALVRVGGPAWLVCLAALTTLAWRAAVERPDGRLHVTAFPGGEVLIESPTGRFVAVSAGASAAALAQALDGRLPLTHPRLDWLVLTRSQIPAADVVQQLAQHAPQGILAAGGGNLPAEQGANPPPLLVVRAAPGMELDLGRGAVATLVRTETGQPAIAIRFGLAEILVFDGGGTRTMSTTAVSNATAVVLLGEGREVARALSEEWAPGATWLIVAAPLPGDSFPAKVADNSALPVVATPFQGWIRLSTDGARLWVEAERAP
jgi:competence protein ComEC